MGQCGWTQRQGGPVEEIRPGNIVWFSPDEKHWHGATATTGMTHIAIQEVLPHVVPSLALDRSTSLAYSCNYDKVTP